MRVLEMRVWEHRFFLSFCAIFPCNLIPFQYVHTGHKFSLAGKGKSDKEAKKKTKPGAEKTNVKGGEKKRPME